jgi:transposase-like protein
MTNNALRSTMILESVITCPHCATAKSEIMPTDACQFFYTCTGCGSNSEILAELPALVGAS